MKTVIIIQFTKTGLILAYSTLSTFTKQHPKYVAQTIRNYMHRNKTNTYRDVENSVIIMKVDVKR